MRLGNWLKNTFIKGAKFAKNKVIPVLKKIIPIVGNVAKAIPHPYAQTVGNIAEKVGKGVEIADKIIPNMDSKPNVRTTQYTTEDHLKNNRQIGFSPQKVI